MRFSATAKPHPSQTKSDFAYLTFPRRIDDKRGKRGTFSAANGFTNKQAKRDACLLFPFPFGGSIVPHWICDMRSASLLMTVGAFTAPVCIWVGANLYGANGSTEPENRVPPWATIERTHKSDRLVSFVKTAANTSGLTDSAFAAIEVAGPLASAIVVRDQNGRVLYSADPATRTTLIAKRPISPAALPLAKDRDSPDPKEASPPDEIPEGCEGAFSPYAAPRMARVIGRCISGIANDRQVAFVQ